LFPRKVVSQLLCPKEEERINYMGKGGRTLPYSGGDYSGLLFVAQEGRLITAGMGGGRGRKALRLILTDARYIVRALQEGNCWCRAS